MSVFVCNWRIGFRLCFPGVTRFPVGGHWRTPGWCVRRTMFTFASCAWGPLWTTRWDGRPAQCEQSAPSCAPFSVHMQFCDKANAIIEWWCPFSLIPRQYGFNMVMSHPHAVNEIALSLNNKNPRWAFHKPIDWLMRTPSPTPYQPPTLSGVP